MYYKTSNEFYITELKTLASNRAIALGDTTKNYLNDRKAIQKNIVTEFVFSYNGLPTNKSATGHIITCQRNSFLRKSIKNAIIEYI